VDFVVNRVPRISVFETTIPVFLYNGFALGRTSGIVVKEKIESNPPIGPVRPTLGGHFGFQFGLLERKWPVKSSAILLKFGLIADEM